MVEKAKVSNNSLSGIIIISGPSGAGKSELIKRILKYKNTEVIKKYSTRKKYSYEFKNKLPSKLVEIIPLGEKRFNRRKFNYIYKFRNNKIGFYDKPICKTLTKKRFAVVNISDIHIIIKMKKKYKNICCIFVNSEIPLIEKRMFAQGLTRKEIAHRVLENNNIINNYKSHTKLYNLYVNNSGLKKDYLKKVVNFLRLKK